MSTEALRHPPGRPIVGIVLREHHLGEWHDRLGELADRIVSAELDHVTVGDHVSFGDGHGADGLIQAAALLASHPTLRVQTGVFLLPLRHPATVARALATISQIAPGRLEFGVGVGGDDPRELELCGVDPRTRGARMDEALACITRLLTEEVVSFGGRFFEFDNASIRPQPDPPLRILVGGRSEAAVRRAARFGQGWLAVWVSSRRYREATASIAALAAEQGRQVERWHHTIQLWAGFDATRERAGARLRRTMEESYSLPFERFERYTPYGGPADVAAALEPYLEAGCRRFNFVADAPDLEYAIAAVSQVAELLRASV